MNTRFQSISASRQTDTIMRRHALILSKYSPCTKWEAVQKSGNKIHISERIVPNLHILKECIQKGTIKTVQRKLQGYSRTGVLPERWRKYPEERNSSQRQTHFFLTKGNILFSRVESGICQVELRDKHRFQSYKEAVQEITPLDVGQGGEKTEQFNLRYLQNIGCVMPLIYLGSPGRNGKSSGRSKSDHAKRE